MRGLAKGEQSSATNPVLQLITRSGEFLTDPVEATYKVEAVTTPSGTPNVEVAQAPVNLDLVADGGQKLGDGRFYIPTGDTSSWAYGTHRAVCTYKMETGGREFTQVTEFELISATLFPSGQNFVAYVTTRDLYADGLFTFAGNAPETLHRHINRASQYIEQVTMRFFEPRYMAYRTGGQKTTQLLLDEAIVAIEGIDTASRDAEGAETFEEMDKGIYQVYNRHMDGLINPDDRHNPRIATKPNSVFESANTYVEVGLWPPGRQNIRIRGIFGFVDPSPQSDRIAIGAPPADLQQVIMALVDRYVDDPALGSVQTQSPGKVRSYRTRDQSIQFWGNAETSSGSGGWTGDPMLDQILQRYVKPAKLSFPDRDPFDVESGVIA